MLAVLPVLLPTSDPALDGLARRAIETVVPGDTKLDDYATAVGVVDRASGTVRWGGFQADRMRYPASVVKLFWLAYARKLIADGKLKTTPELDRAMRDMIVDSTNDATALVVDAVTETTGGAELPPKELAKWMERRQAANRWFKELGYTGINACQKTWNEGPYGRERQGYGPKFDNRNMMSPLAGLRLLSEIMLDRIVNPKECLAMRELLHRANGASQTNGFIGEAIAPGYEEWSKAGWTDKTRHDVAWIKAPDGREVILSIFSENHASDATLLPKIARELLKGLDMAAK